MILWLAACASSPGDGHPPPPAPATVPPAEAAEAFPLRFLEHPDDPAADLPIVVSIHGVQGRAGRMLAVVERCGLPVRVVAPIAPGGVAWFPLHPETPDHLFEPEAARASTALLSGFLDAVSARRPHPGKLILVGFSQGGLLAWSLAATRPELVGAAVPMAGSLPDAIRPDPLPASLPVIRHFHPEHDSWVAPDLARNQGFVQWRAAGGDASFTVVTGARHELAPMQEPLCGALRELLSPPR